MLNPLMSPVNPMETRKTSYYLNLIQTASKTQNCSEVLFAAGKETIHARFPSDKWIHVYTDGFKLEANGNVGADIHSERFARYLTLDPVKSAFDGEVEAIRVTLKHLNAQPFIFEQAVIFSDLQAAILSIANCCHAPDTASTWQ